jgi:hypothetical protein
MPESPSRSLMSAQGQTNETKPRQPIRTNLHADEKSEALVVWRKMMSIRRGFHWVLTVAFVHLFACAIPVGPASAADAESGIDRPGGDYRNFDLEPSIAGFGPCQSSCESDGRCKTWTFVKSGVQGPKARCWLKDSIPNAVKNNCCVSGVSRPDKPIKHTGKSTPPAPSSSLGSQVLAYAVKQLGKCVDSAGKTRDPCPPLAMGKVGEGECTHLVQAAVASVGGKYSSGSYVWGDKVTTYQPGDVIQLFNVKLVGPNGWWETSSQHSAIIESVNGNVLGVIEQNTWVDNKNRRYVTRGTIHLDWKLERGNYIVYRPAK